jgi:hypothetical protein
MFSFYNFVVPKVSLGKTSGTIWLMRLKGVGSGRKAVENRKLTNALGM